MDWTWRCLAGVLASFACVACARTPSATPAQQRGGMMLSDVHITGEFLTPTPAAAGGLAEIVPGGAPAGRPTLGPIVFQTPTPVPTGPTQVNATDASGLGPQASISPVAATSGAAVQTSGSIPQQPRRTPTQPPVPTATPVALTKGQSMQVNLPAGTASCDTSQTFKFRYPGDSSIVTLDAQLDGLSASDAANAGMHVWDSTSTSAPVINVTTLTNQINNVLGSMEVKYQRPIAGPVTIELYNWTQTALTGTVTVVTLASNYSPLEVVQQKSPGAC